MKDQKSLPPSVCYLGVRAGLLRCAAAVCWCWRVCWRASHDAFISYSRSSGVPPFILRAPSSFSESTEASNNCPTVAGLNFKMKYFVSQKFETKNRLCVFVWVHLGTYLILYPSVFSLFGFRTFNNSKCGQVYEKDKSNAI